MDRRPHSFGVGRPPVRGVDMNVGNVGCPPLGQRSGAGRSDLSNLNHSRGSKRRNRHRNKSDFYFSDNMLLARMKQYLEENTESVQVDFDHMVHYFQTKYRDYATRKQSALRGMLMRGHDAIMDEFRANAEYAGLMTHRQPGSSQSSEDEGEDDEGEMADSYQESMHSMNNSRSNYVANRRASIVRPSDEQEELINISSSDEGSEAKKPKPELSSEPRKSIPPLIPPHLLSVIRKAETEVFPVAAYNGGAHHSGGAKPAVTVTSLHAGDVSLHGNGNDDRSRKRKAAAADARKAAGNAGKKKREVPELCPPVTFKDFGGNSRVLTEVCKLLVHMRHPEVYRQIGVSPPRGFLLHGPPGCGKTLLAHAIAGELQVPLIKVASPELVTGVSGESEERIRDLFAQAVAAAPCVLFMDEVDAVTPNRHTAQREMERRIVAQLLSSLDELGQTEFGDQVLVIGATNRPDSIDPALRRAGRFDREVCLGIPDLQARRQILKVLCGNLRLAPDLSFDDIARNTPGYVGADLMALTREAAMAAVNRVFGELKNAVVPNPASPATKRDEKPVEEIILLADEPKAKADDKEVVVDIDAEDSIKVMENGKPKEDDKMEVCEVAADNGDCIVLDETPEKKSENADIDGKEKAGGAKDKEASEEQEKAKKKPEIAEKKCEEKMAEGADEQQLAAKKEVEVGNESTAEEVTEDLKKQPLVTDSDAAPKPLNANAAGPDLDELISWLHDAVPLTPAQLALLHIERSDFELALKTVQPSAKREGFATVPDVTWDDVGALADVRDELQMAILAPVKHAAEFAELGLTTPTGVLLCGPPGCGKTFLAKAVANEAGINFISVKGPELLNMYVGESERAVRQCFQRARNSAPCVIFFDELDALCPKRSDSGEGGASMRVVNQMLTEMDGVEGRRDVYLMAATNRPDIVDPAVLRPGRLDKILYVGMPSGSDRVLILQALTKGGTKPALSADVSLARLGECPQTDGYTGADLAALVREAAMQALRERLADGASGAMAVADKHFDQALTKIRPSVSEKDRKYYEKLRQVYTAVPSANSGQ